MSLTCGWPKGTHTEDGWCDAPVVVAYLVKVYDVPLVTAEVEPREAVLMLCAEHRPDEPQVHGREL